MLANLIRKLLSETPCPPKGKGNHADEHIVIKEGEEVIANLYVPNMVTIRIPVSLLRKIYEALENDRTELLELTAKLAHYISCQPKIEAGSADICNLNELALASLGFKDNHPQVPLEKIINYVKDRLGKHSY